MNPKALALTALLNAACLPKQGLETSLVEPVTPIEDTIQTEQSRIGYDWMLDEDAAALGTTVEHMDAGVGAPALYLTSLLGYSLALKKNTELLEKGSEKLRLHAPHSSNPLSCNDYFTVDRLIDDQVKSVYNNNELMIGNSVYFNDDKQDLHLENLANTWQRRFTEARQDYQEARQSFEDYCGENHLLE